MTRASACFVLACLLLVSTAAGADETPRVVLGPKNPDLFDGAAALIAGDAEKGVRLTHAGLAMATGRRERVMGLSNLCAGYVLLEQYETALGYCNQALELSDRHWRSLSNRALINLKLERYEESQRDVEKGLSIAPNSRELKTVRSMLLDEIDPVSEKITIDDRRGEPEP